MRKCRKEKLTLGTHPSEAGVSRVVPVKTSEKEQQAQRICTAQTKAGEYPDGTQQKRREKHDG